MSPRSQQKGMSRASLEQWLQRLERLHPTEIELGLERVTAVASKLDLLPLAQPAITVAGTNGKGSTVAVLEALLMARGHSIGAFTSPHFRCFNERIRVAGAEVTDDEIVEAFQAIDVARGEVSLTYFEFATLAALLIFRARKTDIVVLEVGLGGRLDSVNIVDAAVSVITSIDLDHQGWLGNTRAEISVEKAGIARSGRPLVIADPDPPQALLHSAQETGASPVLVLGRDFSVSVEAGEWRGDLQSEGGAARRQLSSRPVASLLPENIVAALQAALLLGEDFSEQEVDAALAVAAPTGRRELQSIAGRDYVLDVAHNPAAVNKLHEYIDATPCKGKNIALFSAMEDKDIPGMISAAGNVFDAWFLAEQPTNERAASAADTAHWLRETGLTMISVSKNIRQAFRRAQGIMTEGDRLVVFGSFYTVADVLPLLDKDRQKGGAGPDS